jgi:hypothetical protein
MNKLHRARILKWVALLCLLFPLNGNAGQFVDLTAEIETFDWSYHFFVDGIHGPTNSESDVPSLFRKNQKIHCVVGTNSWFMECADGSWLVNGKVQYWFTGTNIINNYQLTKKYTDSGGDVIPAGHQNADFYDSLDGNPGRPVNVKDLMLLQQEIPWLAFCSGPALKIKGRQLYPPSDMWKETTYAPHGFSDRTMTFKDDFGLPISMELFAQSSQPVFQYQVHQTTNVLGWNFPLEFYMVQYEPAGTNGWVASFTARGRITAIGPGTQPQIPKSVLKAAKIAE